MHVTYKDFKIDLFVFAAGAYLGRRASSRLVITSIKMENCRLVMLALMSGDVKWKCLSGFMRASLPLPSPWPPRCRVYWKTMVHGVNTRSRSTPGCFAFACARPSRETCGEGMLISNRLGIAKSRRIDLKAVSAKCTTSQKL